MPSYKVRRRQPHRTPNKTTSSKYNAKQQCPFCMKNFVDLSKHFFKSKICGQFNGNDKTVVANISSVKNVQGNNFANVDGTTVTQNSATYNTFEIQHTDDVDTDFLCYYDDSVLRPRNKKLTLNSHLLDDADSSTIVDSSELCSTNQDNDSDSVESINDNVAIIANTSYTTDSQIPTVRFSDTITSIVNNYLQQPTAKTLSQSTTSTLVLSHDISTMSIIDFRTYQTSVLKQQTYLPIDHSTIASIKLLKLMIDGNISNCHYANIIHWFKDTMLSTTSFKHNTTQSLIKDKKILIRQIQQLMYQSIHPTFCLKPIHSLIRLPSGKTTKISKFALLPSLLSTLTDPDIMQFQNLLIGDKSYVSPSTNSSEHIEDIHHSQAFITAHNKYCTMPNDILVPIIPFIDGTPIDPYGRNKLEVVMYTLGIFNQPTRNKTYAWNIAGYIPDPCSSHTGQKEKNDISSKKKSISKRSDYHAMLTYLLKDFIDLEESNGIMLNIPNATNTQLISYRLKFVLLFVIGDAVGHDKLCDRYANYGINVKRLCRDCNCPSDLLDNYKHKCVYTKRSDLKAMSKNDLSAISYYKIDNNVFDKFSFGGNVYGVNGCLPPEPLHQLNQGVFKKLIEFFDDSITSNGKSLLDDLVKYISMNSHRQATSEYPSIHIFKDGIDKCQLTGTEIIYKIFIIYLCLIQTYFITQLPQLEQNSKERYKTKKTKQINDIVAIEITSDDEDDNHDQTNYTAIVTKHFYKKIGQNQSHILEWIKLFEATLCFDAWVSQSSFAKDEFDTTSAHQCKADIAIRNYMKLYTSLIKDPIGNGTKTSKIHQMLHITHNITQFGPPKAYNGQTPEHCLSPLVKSAARLTQLRPSTLIEQSCERYYENLIINRAIKLLKCQNVIPRPTTEPTYISSLREQSHVTNSRAYLSIGKYTINLSNDFKFRHFAWNKSRKQNKVIMHNEKLIESVVQRLLKHDFGLESKYLNCCTTLHMHDEHQQSKHTYRADPYFYKRPWMDWCLSSWENDDTNETKLYPCRLYMFIDTLNMKFKLDISEISRYWAVIKSSENDSRNTRELKNKTCSLITTFDADTYIRIIPCNTIVKPVFVIPDIVKITKSGDNTTFESKQIIMLNNQKDWPKMFIESKWL